MRMRRQSPKLTASAIAPIVQKLNRCAIAPKIAASANASNGTSQLSRATSSIGDPPWPRQGLPTPGAVQLRTGARPRARRPARDYCTAPLRRRMPARVGPELAAHRRVGEHEADRVGDLLGTDQA